MFKNEYEIASYIDHTFLKAYASKDDLKKLCDEARQYKVKMVAINPYWVKYCKEELKDTDIHVGAAIGFPLGQNTIETKCFETEDSIKDGADEIDYVINISYVKENRYDLVREEMEKIVSICRKNNVISKVIFENCYLTKDEIVKLSKLASEVKPDFIKTSTGFGTGAATLEDVKLMIENCGDVSVKAAGGIRSFDEFKEFVKLGAKRIGTSSAIKIIEGFKNQV
ncbi:MAG: deoxyribose-phosphate aldolase [Erysipelotrichaceae bacterium]|nr:deoxyribose-phosphate aldolase [Erysipelotrichaceae bacterium]